MNHTWQSIEQALSTGMPLPLAQGATPDSLTNPDNLVNAANSAWQIIQEQVVPLVKDLVTAIAILIVGWIIAAFAAKIVRGILQKTEIDNRIAAWITGQKSENSAIPIEKWLSQAVFWAIILLTIIGALEALKLSVVSEPLQAFLRQISDFLPKFGGAALLLGIAWFLATVAKIAIPMGLKQIGLDEKLNQQVTDTTGAADADATDTDATDTDATPAPPSTQYSLSNTIANVVYWFIFLLFLPSVLSTLQLQGTLRPVQNLLDNILAILPNILGAVVIGAVGWFIAQIVRRVVTNLLAAAKADQLGEKFGISRSSTGQSLSWVVGTIVYVLVLIPTAIAALNALQIKAISDPAVGMLDDILAALPKILGAVLIMGIAFVVAKFVSELVSNILKGIGFDNVFYWLGLQSEAAAEATAASEDTDETPAEAAAALTTAEKIQQQSPSDIVGILVLVGILLLAATAAIDVLQIEALAKLVEGILIGAGSIVAGLIVFAVGLYLANFTFKLIASSGGKQARILAQAARIIIITFAGFMGLQQIGIATKIVHLAFGLLMGAIALAIAIAFGWGGRDVAGELLREWLAAFKQSRDS